MSPTPHPSHIALDHWEELTGASGIDADISRLNWETLSGFDAFEKLYPDVSENRAKYRLNTGALRSAYRRAYENAESGGLCCSGLDPLARWRSPMEWWQIKLRDPLPNPNKPGKFIKYQAPKGVPTRSFWLQVTRKIWERIAQRTGVAMPQHIIETPDGAAINFWPWVVENNISMVITEGAKKAGALLTAGYAAIALPGVTNWGITLENGQRVLRADLKVLATPGRIIRLAFDQDTKRSTRQKVGKQLNFLARALHKQGCAVEICSWDGKEGKGADDFIVNGGDFARVVNNALPVDLWRAISFSQLTYKRDVIVPQDCKYIGTFFQDKPIPSSKLICIKGGKGTGKTELAAQWVAAAQVFGRPVLLIGHRIQLVEALAERFGIPTIYNIKDSATGKTLGYGLCTDSLRETAHNAFDPETWKDAIVVIDECEQVLWHTLEAQTEVSNHRLEVTVNLSHLFAGILSPESKGKIILADADLSDLSVDFVLSHAPKSDGDTEIEEIEPFIIESEYRGNGYDAYIYQENKPDVWLHHALTQIKQGQRLLIMVGSQKAKSKWGTKSLDRCISKLDKEIGKLVGKLGVRVLRVDAETVANPQHPAYHISSRLDDLQTYDVVICSPTFETGISIDFTGHFDAVFLASFGLQTADAVRQSLMRLRDNVPRHIWVAERGMSRIGNGSISPYALLKSERKKADFTLKHLQGADFDLGFEGTESYQWLWAKFAARHNYDFIHYRQEIINGLIDEGHNIIYLDPGEHKETRELVKNARDEVYTEEKEQTLNAAKIDSDRAKTLQEKREKTDSERYELARYIAADRLGDENLDIEILKAMDKGLYTHLQTHYDCSEGREFLRERTLSSAENLLEKGGGKALPHDFNRRTKRGKIAGVIECLDAMAFIATISGKEITNQHPAIVDLYERAQQYRSVLWDLDMKLPVKGSKKDSPIVVANMFLRRLAMRLACVRVQGKKRTRVYSLAVLFGDRRASIFERWRERDLERRAEETAKRQAGAIVPPEVIPPVELVPLRSLSELKRGIEVVWRGARWLVDSIAERFGQAVLDPIDGGLPERCYQLSELAIVQ